MKKKSIIIALLSIFTLFVVISNSNAVVTEQYQRYIELSDEEKEGAIEPKISNINIENGIKASSKNKYVILKEKLKDKYILTDNIKINVKNQMNTNSCWTFVTTSSLETNIALKTKKESPIFSTRHMEYATSRTFLDGINKKGFNREVGSGGDYRIGFAYLVNGQGAIYEEDMPFEDNEDKINLSEIDKNPRIKINDYAEFPGIYKEYDENGKIVAYTNGYDNELKKNYTQDEVDIVRTAIKEHIKENGGLAVYTYLDYEGMKYYNIDENNNYTYYCNNPLEIVNHAVTIVGWDDTFKKENFRNVPKNDGAYIALNSWGEENLNKGYFYISYDDALVENSIFGIINTSEIDYDTLYQHDEYGYTTSMPLLNSKTEEILKTIYAANVFERNDENKPKDGKKYKEYLNEISVYVGETSDIEIYVNPDDDNKPNIKKVATPGVLEPGYHTVKFDSPIELTGDKFVVAARYNSNNGVKIPFELNYLENSDISTYWDVVTSEEGESFVSPSGILWTDVKEIYNQANLCIKAFTTFEEVKNINVESVKLNENKKTIQVGEEFTLLATIIPNNAENKNITWESKDEKIAKVSDKGIVTGIKEGKTTITVTTEDGNKTAECDIVVQEKDNSKDNTEPKEETNEKTKKEEINEKSNSKDTNVTNEVNDAKVVKDTKDTKITKNDSSKKNGSVTKTTNSNDATTAKKILPYTGTEKIIVSIVVILGIGIVIFIKYRRMKDIK